MTDSTVFRAHHCVVELKRGSGDRGAWSIARWLYHQAASPLRWSGTTAMLRPDPRQAHDVKGFGALFGMLVNRVEALIADKGSDADSIREELAKAEVEAVIPSKSSRRIPIPHDREKYCWRNLIVRLFSKLKD